MSTILYRIEYILLRSRCQTQFGACVNPYMKAQRSFSALKISTYLQSGIYRVVNMYIFFYQYKKIFHANDTDIITLPCRFFFLYILRINVETKHVIAIHTVYSYLELYYLNQTYVYICPCLFNDKVKYLISQVVCKSLLNEEKKKSMISFSHEWVLTV